MPFLRYKRWQYLTPLAPAVAICASHRRYVCTGADQGVVEVPYAADAAELLDPTGDRRSQWEVAWERYGVTFDATGREVLQGPPIRVLPQEAVDLLGVRAPTLTASAPVAPAPTRKRTR